MDELRPLALNNQIARLLMVLVSFQTQGKSASEQICHLFTNLLTRRNGKVPIVPVTHLKRCYVEVAAKNTSKKATVSGSGICGPVPFQGATTMNTA